MKKSKILSVFLVLALLLSILPSGVYATEDEQKMLTNPGLTNLFPTNAFYGYVGCRFTVISSALESFSGTATELSEKIETACGNKITPAVLSKKLIGHHSQLEELGFLCEFRRTHKEKIIEIICAEK